METNLGEKWKNPTPSFSKLELWPVISDALTGHNKYFSCKERKAELKVEVTKFRNKLKELDNLIRPLETKVECNTFLCETEIDYLKNLIARIEKKPRDAKILFEKAVKSKQESSVALEKWLKETMTAKCEFQKVEDVLNRHRCYGGIFFKCAPPEWQEAKKVEILKAQDTQKEHYSEPEENADSQSVESSPDERPSLESNLSMQLRDTLLTDSFVAYGSNSDEIVEIYFSDPFEVVVLQSELTDQILSLIENATEMDKMLEQTLEITRNKMKEDETKLTMQENNLKSKTEMEKKRGVILKKQVQLHKSLKKQDQDILLEALGRKVTEVYCRFLESRLINLATLEKLCSVEYRMTMLLQQIENIPEDMFETLWEIKNIERRTRLHEEQLRLEREKQKEKMNKCRKRALGESTKVPGRKLMQRCIPVQKKVQVSTEPSPPVEEDPHADLFTEEGD